MLGCGSVGEKALSMGHRAWGVVKAVKAADALEAVDGIEAGKVENLPGGRGGKC